jgi:hypothetical protein
MTTEEHDADCCCSYCISKEIDRLRAENATLRTEQATLRAERERTMSKKCVFEGIATERLHFAMPGEWWSLENEAGGHSIDVTWFAGLNGRRVRITVEVLDDAEPEGAHGGGGSLLP